MSMMENLLPHRGMLIAEKISRYISWRTKDYIIENITTHNKAAVWISARIRQDIDYIDPNYIDLVQLVIVAATTHPKRVNDGK